MIKQQRGAVLIVSMVILLVMTLIGVSIMNSSTLQERMAGNDRQKDLSLYAAESALRVGETWLQDNITAANQIAQQFIGNGLYAVSNQEKSSAILGLQQATATDEFDYTDSSLWTDDNSVEIDVAADSILSKRPRYFIEYLGTSKGVDGPWGEEAGNKEVNDAANDNDETNTRPHVFRIVAIGWGQNDRITTMLQSTYKTGSADFNYNDAFLAPNP